MKRIDDMSNDQTVEIFGEKYEIGLVLEKLGKRQAEHEEKLNDLQALLPLLRLLRTEHELICRLVFGQQGALESIHGALTRLLAKSEPGDAKPAADLRKAIGEIEELKRLFEK